MENNFELTKELLKEILEEKEENFTLEEIEQLMDSEVEKPEDEVDTELVDMCASILAKAYNPDFKEEKPAQMYRPWEKEAAPESKPEAATPEKPKKKVIPFKRVLVVAAAVVIIAVIALTAGATLFGKSDSQGVIEFYEDFFKISLNKDEPTTADIPANDAVSEMIINNLGNFMLPDVLRGDEYEKSARLEQKEFMTIFYIRLINSDENISGTIVITQYNDANHNMTNGQVNVSDVHRNFKQLTIDGKEIIVFGMGEESYINYSDGATNYQISLGCEFDTMVSIAETINVKG